MQSQPMHILRQRSAQYMVCKSLWKPHALKINILKCINQAASTFFMPTDPLVQLMISCMTKAAVQSRLH